MNLKSTSRPESLVDSVNEGPVTLQQLVTILDQLIETSDKSLTDVTSIKVMDKGS